MLNYKNKKAGFTLVEILIAVAILVLMITASITTISLISQTRAKRIASTVMSKFELTRDYAKTHGGDATFYIQKVDDGLLVKRTSQSVVDEEELLEDKTLKVYYKLTGDDVEYELGKNDALSVKNNQLVMTFRQTTGAIIGPDKVDYLVIANNNKVYTLVIQQSTGMIYYDYEIDNDKPNQKDDTKISVDLPTFIYNGQNTVERISIPLGPQQNGKYASVQPELNYDSRYVRISGEVRANAPGVYHIVFSLKDPYSTYWGDMSSDVADKELAWEIPRP